MIELSLSFSVLNREYLLYMHLVACGYFSNIVTPGGEALHNYSGVHGEAPPERGTAFFSLQVYERVVISLVEVYEMVGKSVIWVCERAQNG